MGRLKYRTFGLDPDALALLKAKARAHGVSEAEYVRSVLSGRLPGAGAGTDAALADRWWASRQSRRRVSIWRNHATAPTELEQAPGQMTIFDRTDQEEG